MEFEGLEQLLKQLSEYGNNVNLSKTLSTSEEQRKGYLQGFQHIINGGSIQDVVAEMNLCLEVEEDERAQGFMKALDFVKRYIQNILEINAIGEAIGKDTSVKLFQEMSSQIYKNIEF